MSLEAPGHLWVTSLVCGGCQVRPHASRYILVIVSLSEKSFNLFLSRSGKMSGASQVSHQSFSSVKWIERLYQNQNSETTIAARKVWCLLDFEPIEIESIHWFVIFLEKDVSFDTR